MAGPLEGIRVVDVTQMISGPVATMLLGDQGADVVKVEPPGSGDFVRSFGARREGFPAVFTVTNRNKRSIAVDLRREEGVALVHRLVASADVFVQNFRPGRAERMGLGEAALRAAQSDLVYVSISGFGETGPYADQRVYDPVVQALSGICAIQADETGRPRMLRLIVPDKLTALTAAQATTAALFARERTGEGQHVRLSMLDAMVAFLWPEGMARHTYVGERGEKVGTSRPLPVRDLVFETRDGWITAGAQTDAEWEGLCRALDRTEWLADERFRSAYGRTKHIDERLEMTAAVLRTRSSAEWLARLRAHEVPCAPIHRREDVLEDPQIAANALIVESVHPHAGRMRQPRPAARFDRTPASLRRPAPAVGEQTDEILSELGLGAEEVRALREGGVVA